MLVTLCVECCHGKSNAQFGLENADFVFAFFSSISYHLEGMGNWGKRFPRLLLDLCDHGWVDCEDFDELSAELTVIRRELRRFSLDDAVCDIGDLSRTIPFERLPGTDWHDLSMPWVTILSAKPFFDLFEEAMQWARTEECPLLMVFPMEVLRKDTLRIRKRKGRDYWLQYEEQKQE